MKKVIMEPPERLANLQALWENQTVAELGPCGECVYMLRLKCAISGSADTGTLNLFLVEVWLFVCVCV